MGPPNIYLGAEINTYQLNSGRYHGSMSSTHYVKNAIKTVEVLLKNEERKLRKVNSSGYQPF